MRDCRAKEVPPSFEELFSDQDDVVRREALSASEAIPQGVDHLKVRRLLAKTKRIEMVRRLMVDWRQDYWHVRRDAGGAAKYLARLVKHVAPQSFPELRRALESAQYLARLSPKGPGIGRPRMTHYRTALEEMTAMKIAPDDARAMLRGIGITIRPPGSQN